MDVQAYINRIGYRGSLEPTADSLAGLQRAHLYSVPFENLDIHLGRPIRLEEAALFDKIVSHRRGGFCYELNSLFAGLLKALGYQVTLLSAASVRDDGGYDPDFDHLVLQVTCPAAPQVAWLADVGWGNGSLEPVQIFATGEQAQGSRTFKIEAMDGGRVLEELVAEAGAAPRWIKHYRFTLQPRRIEDFFAMCRYHQESPESPFPRKPLCTLFTPDGRVTLSGNRLILTRNGAREERDLDENAAQSILSSVFGMEMAGGNLSWLP